MRLPIAHWLPRFVVLTALSAAPLAPAQTPTSAAPGAESAATVPLAPTPAAPPEPVADDASSYSVGLTFGNQMHTNGLDRALSLDAVVRGLKDGLSGKAVSSADRDRALQLVRAGREAEAARNRGLARDFLAKNGAIAKVTTTASGLQYTVFAAGDAKAAAPTLKDRVTINYRGRLLDGTEFDNSDAHAQAATFGLAGVIKGWREALLLMKPGAKWRLFVPPALAYDTFTPPAIPPGSLLIFDIELLKVEPPPLLSDGGPKGRPEVKRPNIRRAVPAAGEPAPAPVGQ